MDTNEAYELIIRKAHEGDFVFMAHLGFSSWLGQGVEKNSKEAVRWIQLAGESNDAEFLVALAEELEINYESSEFTSPDFITRLYQRACTLEEPIGAYGLGRHYCRKGNFHEAKRHFKIAIARGHFTSRRCRDLIIQSESFGGWFIYMSILLPMEFVVAMRALKKDHLRWRFWRYRDVLNAPLPTIDERIGTERYVYFGNDAVPIGPEIKKAKSKTEIRGRSN